MSRYTVLPILIVTDQDGAPSVRGLCGAEAAAVRRGANTQLTRMRASAPGRTRVTADVTDLGVLRMILHARSCHRCQALQESGHHPLMIAGAGGNKR